MSIVKVEDIRGARIKAECVCCNCLTDEELRNIDCQDDLFFQEDLEDEEYRYFCDRCTQEL